MVWVHCFSSRSGSAERKFRPTRRYHRTRNIRYLVRRTEVRYKATWKTGRRRCESRHDAYPSSTGGVGNFREMRTEDQRPRVWPEVQMEEYFAACAAPVRQWQSQLTGEPSDYGRTVKAWALGLQE